ncbi:hypothetical protein [Fumia xinanensis]|uniref:hypothetical protein n=1 Tax=Fumia xinanensis TaxID=2763659 RepID=UPI0020164493|nr:hypothetical protein [Fumia xinanensis]
MNEETFKQACRRVRDGNQQALGIGTLGEKTLHAVLKYGYEPQEENHETKIGGYVADIVGENGIIEIQTQGFDRLRKKLSAFLEVCDVTVVYPVAAVKWLSWIDSETGAISPRRKSPRRGKLQDSCTEFYKIRNFLGHPRLHLKIVLLELEEYRYQNGWGNGGKRGSARCDRIPISFLGEISLDRLEDYRILLPRGLPTPFTTADFRKAAAIPPKATQCTVNLLYRLGIIQRVGKQGRCFLYEITAKKEVTP